MRTITIHQSDTDNIVVLDDNDDPIDQYCAQLSELMKMGNISILKTSSAQVVLRPSKVVGIKVEEGAVTKSIIPPITQPEETKEVAKKIVEDIITDVDS